MKKECFLKQDKALLAITHIQVHGEKVKFKPIVKDLYSLLYDRNQFFKANGNEHFDTVKWLASFLGASTASITRGLKDLSDFGLLEYTTRTIRGSQKKNFYRRVNPISSLGKVFYMVDSKKPLTYLELLLERKALLRVDEYGVAKGSPVRNAINNERSSIKFDSKDGDDVWDTSSIQDPAEELAPNSGNGDTPASENTNEGLVEDGEWEADVKCNDRDIEDNDDWDAPDPNQAKHEYSDGDNQSDASSHCNVTDEVEKSDGDWLKISDTLTVDLNNLHDAIKKIKKCNDELAQKTRYYIDMRLNSGSRDINYLVNNFGLPQPVIERIVYENDSSAPAPESG